MSLERRSCASSAPHVTRRLIAILVLLIGLICIFGGYLLGRMPQNEVKRSNDIITHNLTVIADNLYKKAKRILPKVIHQNDLDKIQTKLVDIFNCSESACGTMNKYNLSDFVKNSINFQVSKLMRTIYNASVYLDSLR